jgi:hypothetical protein
MRKMLKAKPEKPLAERIADFRDELDQFIDSRTEEIRAEAPGVPLQVLRNILTNRAGGCQCQAVKNRGAPVTERAGTEICAELIRFFKSGFWQ